MRQLIDGDCPIDHSQWAMQAGTTITANNGWTRIYHPGQVAVDRCDPHGLFIRRWLPELADLTNDQLGAPPPMGAYPRPILDYDSARRERIATLQRQRQQIVDIRRGLSRLPEDLTPFGLPRRGGDGGASAQDLFPPAIDLDALGPDQWPALLSWFRPGRNAAPPEGSSGNGPSSRRSGSDRRRSRRSPSSGQLSLDLT
jgi:deoxyribodipyrimidine photo-lyase